MSDPDRKRRLVGLVLFAVTLGAVLLVWLNFRARTTTELPVYVEGAARMAQGEPIYRKTDAKPFTYPPFFAVPFLPWISLEERQHRALWYAVNVGALGGLLWLAWRIVRDAATTPRARTVFWLGMLALAGRHLSSVVENQSHDLLIALGVTAGVVAWRGGAALVAGALFGLAAACKATPLLFLLPLFFRREIGAVLALVGVACGATLLPDLLWPQAGGKLWVVSWFETFLSGLAAGGTATAEGAWTAGSFLNQSLSGTLHRLTTAVANESGFVRDVALADLAPEARKMVILGGQLAIVAWLAWLARRRAPGSGGSVIERVGVGAATACGMVLLSPMSSKAHFCVLLIPAAFCLRETLVRRDRLLWCLLGAWALAGLLSMKGLVGTGLGNRLLAYGSVTWTTVLALAATARGLALVRRESPA